MKYGLIGQNISYSYSKLIHEFLLEYYQIAASYEIIDSAKLNKNILKKYSGLNVTIPYKEKVHDYLDNKMILPCNTIKNDKGNLLGYNTDYQGFCHLLLQLQGIKINKVVILGSGASSKLVQYVLKDYELVVISRQSKHFNYELLSKIEADLLVNTTPVGMNEDKSPVAEKNLTNFKAVIDLNYNPLNSRLALDCHKKGVVFINGLEMLIVQAVKSFEIWQQITVNNELYQKLLLHVLQKSQKKIAIIGFSLSGKTTIVKQFSGIDLDEEIVKKYSEEIATMLHNQTFRSRETKTLQEVVTKQHYLLACGGGIVLNHDNMVLLKDYLIIYLKEDYQILKERLKQTPRPLIQNDQQLELMIKQREKLYERYANIVLSYQALEEFLHEVSNYQWT